MFKKNSDLIYTLNQKPSLPEAVFAAFQHFISIFIPIITPTLIIGNILNFYNEIPYLISMALMVSGVATFIQVKKFGFIGSGLLSIQGTSFSFLPPILAMGLMMKGAEKSPAEILSTIFTVCFFGAFVEIIASRFLDKLKEIITPIVTGTVVTIIGLTLVKESIINIGGGNKLLENNPAMFANYNNLLLAAVTIIIIILCNISRSRLLRMTSIFIGLLAGFILSLFLMEIDFSSVNKLPVMSLPVPFKYGFNFSWQFFLPIALIYLITTIEAIGDLTATSIISNEPISGKAYLKRIKGGVMGDGVNSLIASMFNTFPNTTFSQNNGVIQLTGVASRFVGMLVAVFLFVFGLFPFIGGVFRLIPNPVIGAATLIMFGTVAAAGIKIITSTKIDRKSVMIISVSFGLGLGVEFVPEILQNTSQIVQNIFGSPISIGGITAIFLSIILPKQ